MLDSPISFVEPHIGHLAAEEIMSKNMVDPSRKLLAEFQAGRLSRRQFLVALSALASGVALGSVPIAAARNAPVSFRSVAGMRRAIDPKVMIYGASQDIATIDPSDRTDYSINAIMRQMYDRLFRLKGAGLSLSNPGLAQKWSVSDDAKEWTFEITDKSQVPRRLSAQRRRCRLFLSTHAARAETAFEPAGGLPRRERHRRQRR